MRFLATTVVLVLVGLLAACTVRTQPFVAYDEQPARFAAEAFAQALVDRDYARAYDLLSADAKAQSDLETFTHARQSAEAAGRGVIGHKVGIPLPLGRTDPQSALQAPVRFFYEDGDSSELGLTVVNEDGTWRIHFSG